MIRAFIQGRNRADTMPTLSRGGVNEIRCRIRHRADIVISTRLRVDTIQEYSVNTLPGSATGVYCSHKTARSSVSCWNRTRSFTGRLYVYRRTYNISPRSQSRKSARHIALAGPEVIRCSAIPHIFSGFLRYRVSISKRSCFQGILGRLRSPSCASSMP